MNTYKRQNFYRTRYQPTGIRKSYKADKDYTYLYAIIFVIVVMIVAYALSGLGTGIGQLLVGAL